LGELAGVGVGVGDVVAAGVETGNANVCDGNGEGVPDAVDEGDGEGLGVGEGIMFSQRCNGTLVPPISFASISQRA